ncbi:ORF-68 [Teiidae poxvirus 1]|nr:ORF-68 [Teiidae poxvirus 1]
MSRTKILVGITGGIAVSSLPLLIQELLKLRNVELRVIATQNALRFTDQKEIGIPIYTDNDEWVFWTRLSDPVLHIELKRWADALVIAPLTANTLAKIATGICDNLLTNVVRAWDNSKPLIFCPAMNTVMWEHPITEHHLMALRYMGYIEIECLQKIDHGKGAMAEVTDIVRVVKDVMRL